MRYESGQFTDLHYLVRYPTDYRKSGKYPMVLLLHGAGGRGSDLAILRNNPYFTITDEYEDFPFLTFAPQCHENTWFDLFEALTAFAEAMAGHPDVDETRVYIIGASMGAYATWQLGMSRPDLFAAMVPICGGGMYWNAGRLKDTPIWAFHGQLDDTVFVEESIKMTDWVRRYGGNPKLTIYPENGHNAWSDTYSNREVFNWLLTHRKEAPGNV